MSALLLLFRRGAPVVRLVGLGLGLALAGAPAPASARSTQPPAPHAGVFVAAGLGGGRIANQYGALTGWAGHVAAGVNRGETVVCVDFLRVEGEARLSPDVVNHVFFGMMIERWRWDRAFLAAGAGISSLSHGHVQNFGLGASFAAGGVPLWLSDQLALTAAARVLIASHHDTLHTTGALLVGLALR